ncbi:MAG: zinc ribbon domain-containing protein [Asgard group archaeon]|nr:zinc ribbon domain-containing protein [Asgard group archaeon]
MGKNISKKILIVLLIFSSLSFFLVINYEPVTATSYNTTLSYGDYYAIYSEKSLSTNEHIDWSFSSSGDVWLDVWIIDDYNFDLFESGYDATGYLVSDFVGDSDSGRFEIPHQDYWYVLFMHNDDYEISTVTSVSIQISFGTSMSNVLKTVLWIGIPVAIVILIIGLRKASSARNQKKKEVEMGTTVIYEQQPSYVEQPYYSQQPTYEQTNSYSRPYTEPLTPPQPAMSSKKCMYCGELNKNENKFCTKCGAQLSYS